MANYILGEQVYGPASIDARSRAYSTGSPALVDQAVAAAAFRSFEAASVDLRADLLQSA